MVVGISGSYNWKRLILFDSQLIESELSFSQDGIIKENFNLQGNKIIPSGLTWNPYLDLKECNSEGRQCQKNGLLVDLMDSWAQGYNFTWDVYEDQTGSWSHHFNDVVQGNYPISLSFWLWLSERDDLLDFVPVTKDFMALSLLHGSTSFDVTFFLRPFTRNTWWCICGMTSFVCLLLILLPRCSRPLSNTSFYNVIELTAFIFFLLINSYYSGALTMFFANKDSLPFQNIREVLQSDWKLLFMNGNEVYFETPAKEGDKDYAAYWKQVKANPGVYNVSGIKDGLESLSTSKTILHSYYSTLAYHKSSNLQTFPPISTFGAAKPQVFYLILPKNYPLTPIFKQASTHLFESGSYNKLFDKWIGSNLPYLL